jgi:hypothetical protein
VDSPYHSESELCGGAVTVSFKNYLPWQVMHFLQRSTHFSKACCTPLITSKFLASELHFHCWFFKAQKSHGAKSGLYGEVFLWGSTDPLLPSRTKNSIQISLHEISGLFLTIKRGLQDKFRSDQLSVARFREVGGAL